jgi:hypothetical protein
VIDVLFGSADHRRVAQDPFAPAPIGSRSEPALDSFGAEHDFSAVPVSVGVVTTLSDSAPPDVWWSSQLVW